MEIDEVVNFVKRLLPPISKAEGLKKIPQWHIGVISPYHMQNYKILQALQVHNMGKVNVGAVESFRSAQKPVMIISTVRSSSEPFSLDVSDSEIIDFVAPFAKSEVSVWTIEDSMILKYTEVNFVFLFFAVVKHGDHSSQIFGCNNWRSMHAQTKPKMVLAHRTLYSAWKLSGRSYVFLFINSYKNNEMRVLILQNSVQYLKELLACSYRQGTNLIFF